MALSNLNKRRIAGVLLSAAMLAVGIPAGNYAQAHLRLAYDATREPCLPHRLFLLTLDDRTPQRGELASFKVRGLTPQFEDGTVFTKLVVGVPGDKVTIEGGYVEVAGKPLGGISARVARGLRRDPASFDRSYVLGPTQYFMAGTEGTPYDSRYYGPVEADQVIAQAHPLW